MLTLDELTPEAKEALIACYRIAAARGRQLRLATRQAARIQARQLWCRSMKTSDPETCRFAAENAALADTTVQPVNGCTDGSLTHHLSEQANKKTDKQENWGGQDVYTRCISGADFTYS